jgi:hypothetical protein
MSTTFTQEDLNTIASLMNEIEVSLIRIRVLAEKNDYLGMEAPYKTIDDATQELGNHYGIKLYTYKDECKEDTQEDEKDTWTPDPELVEIFDYQPEEEAQEEEVTQRQAIRNMVKRFNVPKQYRSKVEYRLLMNVNKGIPVSFTAEELGQALYWEDSLEGHQFWSLMSDIIDTHNAK